jgi:hypothetical protein
MKGSKAEGDHQGEGRPHSRPEGKNKHEPNLEPDSPELRIDHGSMTQLTLCIKAISLPTVDGLSLKQQKAAPPLQHRPST